MVWGQTDKLEMQVRSGDRLKGMPVLRMKGQGMLGCLADSVRSHMTPDLGVVSSSSTLATYNEKIN